MNCQIFNFQTWNWSLFWQMTASMLKKNVKYIVNCTLLKALRWSRLDPAYLNDVTLFEVPPISIVMTPTLVLCECIVQRRYLIFVKLCFDNSMAIIMKVSYMNCINLCYLYLIKYYVPIYHRLFYGKDRKYRASQTLKRHQNACNIWTFSMVFLKKN